MKNLAVLILAAAFAVPACSAETEAPVNPEPSATTASVDRPVAVAQADTDSATEGRINVAAPAERSDIVEGRDYQLLSPAQPTSSSPNKVEVAEMFMYMCPHCYSFEPFIENFVKSAPPYVEFVRVPAPFNKLARNHAKGYYAAETLGVLDDLHEDFFRAYHSQNNRLRDADAIVSFLASNGVPKADAEKAMKSFAVDTKVRQAETLVRRYNITSVPTLVINGKYVTSASMVGSERKLREVIDYLVAKEAAAM